MKQKKNLVPLDGSERAFKTVKYIAHLEPFHKMDVVLFNVFSSVPEAYWDMEKDPRSTSTVRLVKAWEVQQKRNIQEYMQKASRYLLRAGFDNDSVKIKINKRKKGIARDIIAEAKNGYEAVVTRRRGMTGLRQVVLGSVATKLLQRLDFLPLILVGRKTPGNRVLLAFDGSENAMRAVDFVGSTLGDFDYTVCLLHVIRLLSSEQETSIVGKEMQSELKKARTRLIELGFGSSSATADIIKGAYSRAKAIADKARQENFGTIVMGRRGLSRVQNFFIGRVTNKVIHIARDRTVWIIR